MHVNRFGRKVHFQLRAYLFCLLSVFSGVSSCIHLHAIAVHLVAVQHHFFARVDNRNLKVLLFGFTRCFLLLGFLLGRIFFGFRFLPSGGRSCGVLRRCRLRGALSVLHNRLFVRLGLRRGCSAHGCSLSIHQIIDFFALMNRHRTLVGFALLHMLGIGLRLHLRQSTHQSYTPYKKTFHILHLIIYSTEKNERISNERHARCLPLEIENVLFLPSVDNALKVCGLQSSTAYQTTVDIGF